MRKSERRIGVGLVEKWWQEQKDTKKKNLIWWIVQEISMQKFLKMLEEKWKKRQLIFWKMFEREKIEIK